MLYFLVGFFSIIIFKILYFYKIIGRENLPKGKCLICANHTGLSDPIFVAIAMGLCTKNHKTT